MGYTIKPQAEFYVGQPVYVKTDPDQMMGIVIAYRCTDLEVQYEISRGMHINIHSAYELSAEKNVGQYG